MNLFEFAIKFFQDSGLAIYPSILIAAVGLAIAIERFVFLAKARSQNRATTASSSSTPTRTRIRRWLPTATPRSARSLPTA